MAPQTIPLTTLEEVRSASLPVAVHSDVAALMVFDHQVHMTNLLARASWETRAAGGMPTRPR